MFKQFINALALIGFFPCLTTFYITHSFPVAIAYIALLLLAIKIN